MTIIIENTFGPMTDTFNPRSYWEERLSAASGLQGVGYLGLGQRFNAYMYRVRRFVFLRTVRHYVTDLPVRRVLDIGSGTGEYLKYWKELKAGSITGSDLTTTAAERLAREFPGLEVWRMDIADIPTPAPSDQFDAISCMDVLFHIVDDDRFENALRHLHLLLKQEGVLLLSDNFIHGPMERSAHFVARPLAEYEKALAKADLRIIARRPMFHLMNNPVDGRSRWLQRWWVLVMRTCRHAPWLGGLLATVVYPLELLLVSLRKEGVSTEIMVCVRNQ